jgi:ABC-type multidrug transport system fused ATPase/permease subunit
VELFRLIRPEWRLFLLGAVFSLITGFATPLLPTFVVQPLFNDVIGKQQYALILSVLFKGALLLVLSIFGFYIQNTLFALGGARFAARVRGKIFEAMLAASVLEQRQNVESDQGGFSSGGRTARLSLDIREFENFLTFELPLVTGQGLTVIVAFGALFVQNTRLTLGLLLVVFPLGLLYALVGKRIQRAFERTQNAAERATSAMSESLSRLEVIKAFRLEKVMQQRFGIQNEAQTKATLRRSFWSNMHSPISQLTVGIGIGTLVLFALGEIRQGQMSGASLITYLTTMVILIGPLQLFAYSYSRLSAMRDPARSINAAMQTNPEPESGSLEKPVHEWNGAVSFENVSVRYPGSSKLALEQLNLNLEPGEILGVVGASGGGKTTLTRLLLRLLEPEIGSVKLDGQNLRDFKRAATRAAIALVPQQPGLFAMTIGENLRLAKPDANDSELWLSLEQAGLKHEIQALPAQLETQLGEGGSGLSGGQQQRLAIARALVSGAPILILDEPTAALDGHSEALVRESLEKLRGLRTVLVIAHRLSTIESADRIVVLEKGRIVEEGTHSSLMLAPGAYRALVESSSAR